MANEFKVEAATSRKVFFSSNSAAVGVVSIEVDAQSLAATVTLGNLGNRNTLTTETVTVASGESITVAANQVAISAPANGYTAGQFSFDGAIASE